MIRDQRVEYLTTIFLLLAASALLVYAVFRAITIPLTHDEAITVSFFVPQSISDIVGYDESYGMPNNHIANTLFIKLSTAVFGSSPFSVRLPNLLAFAAFLYAGIRLLRSMSSVWLRIGGFVLLTCNPYTFDFFCLARGYGIANAFMLLSLWMFYRWFRQPDAKKSVLLLFYAMLMVLANFATVHLFLGIAGAVALINLKNRAAGERFSFLKATAIPFASTVLLACTLYKAFRCIHEWKQAIGGTTGFWSDCILELASSSLYGAPGAYTIMQLAPYVLFVLLAGIAVISYSAWRKNGLTFLHCLCFLLVITAALFQLQHLLLGSDFPVVRSMQFFYPLFVLTVLFSLDSIRQQRVAVTIFLIATATPAALHFINISNPRYVLEWRYDAMNRQVLTDLSRLAAAKSTPFDVKTTWIFAPGLNYEREFQNLGSVLPFDREGIARTADYYYVTREDSATLANEGKKVIFYYPVSGTSLMK